MKYFFRILMIFFGEKGRILRKRSRRRPALNEELEMSVECTMRNEELFMV